LYEKEKYGGKKKEYQRKYNAKKKKERKQAGCEAI